MAFNKTILLILAIAFLASCKNSNTSQVQIYKDSVNYFSTKLAALADSGYSSDDTRVIIYSAMRKHYIDKMNEAKK